MKENISHELKERTVEGFLDLLILTKLAKNSLLNAEDLMEFIHQKFNVLLSQGLLYSYLFRLEQDGLIRKSHVNNNKVYEITQRGKEKIDVARKHSSAIQWVIDRILEG